VSFMAAVSVFGHRANLMTKMQAASLSDLVRMHPNLAEIYRRKVLDLRVALDREDTREEAVAILRGLIDEIRLKAVDGQLGIYLVGNLAGILDLCTKKHPGSLGAGVQVTLVAGIGFEPMTFRL
jgi:site-specific DNA recombinase